jgi:N-acetylglucosaminyldiphosphoundecaprenol N-acetyl-beta-D-mannosaminyltransferase
MPVAKSFSLLYDIDQKRIAGMNLIEDIFFECSQHQLKIFIYGSTDDVLVKTRDKLSKDFPGLELSFFSPPFRPLTSQEKHDVIDMVNSASPDLIIVALGCPKQEKWMYEHNDLISGCMVGLGGALSVYAGEISRAPLWMQQAGLEWLYRLSKEPRRLFSRYAYTNSKFLMLLFIQFLRVKFRGVK